MDIAFLIRGLIIGFSIAAPVGPIGVLCIRRTIASGILIGVVSGMGAATADATYGFIAAFGLTAISNFLVSQQTLLRLIGGGFLLYLGVRTFLARPAERAAAARAGGIATAYVSTLALTITNPLTILSFAAIFAGLGIADDGGYLNSATVVAGVLLGSALWWVILCGGVSLLRSRFDAGRLRWLNRLSGAVIGVFGVLALVSTVE